MSEPTLPLTTARAREDYERALKLLGTFTRTKHLLAALEAAANIQLAAFVGRHAHKFATLQTRCTEAEAAIKEIAQRHPEWFPDDARTVKTLMGSIHAQKTTSHEVADPAETISLVEAAIETGRHFGLLENVGLLEPCVRIVKTLDLDAVARLGDELLLELGITRKVEDSITVKEAKVKLGTPVKKKGRTPKTNGEAVPA